MKDFVKLRDECLAEVHNAGIEIGNITSWQINRRAKTRWGMCSRYGDKYTIQISSQLVSDDRISEKACKETIIHEILHTCPDCHGHTGKWKEYAELMNVTYGYNIKRVTSGQEKGVENYQASRRLKPKYCFKCMYCGYSIVRKRDSKFTRYYRNYTCPECGKSRAFEKYYYKYKE